MAIFCVPGWLSKLYKYCSQANDHSTAHDNCDWSLVAMVLENQEDSCARDAA